MAPGKAQNSKLDVLVFVSYSHRDDRAREQFDIHTAALKREGVRFWFDGDMIAGDELDPKIRRQLKAADIFVTLASPDISTRTIVSRANTASLCARPRAARSMLWWR